MSSIEYLNKVEEEKLELLDEFYDYNINYRINLCTKGFFDKMVKNVLLVSKERSSILKKGKSNRFSVSNNSISCKNNDEKFIEKHDNSNKCIREARSFFSKIITSIVDKMKDEKKIYSGQKDILFNSFEFNKSNKNNVTVNISRKFFDISIKNCLLKLTRNQSFDEKRKSLELNFLERSGKSNINHKFNDKKESLELNFLKRESKSISNKTFYESRRSLEMNFVKRLNNPIYNNHFYQNRKSIEINLVDRLNRTNKNQSFHATRKSLEMNFIERQNNQSQSKNFYANRRSLELNFIERGSKLLNNPVNNRQEIEVSEFYTKNFDMIDSKNFKKSSQFLSEIINKVIYKLNTNISSIIQNTKTIIKKESIDISNNFENESNNFTKSFFSEKVRNTVTKIYIEKENKESNCNSYTKGFLNENIRKTISSIDKEALSESYKNIPKFEHRKSSIKDYENNQNTEPFKRLSSKLEDRINKKDEEEFSRKSKIIEQKIIMEQREIEKEFELSKIKNVSNCFWNKTFQNTMVKYEKYYDNYLKCVIKIQSNFRMSLWKFIIKIELMNTRLQRENERAMAASRKRRSIILIKPKIS